MNAVYDHFIPFVQVIIIDLTLAADNAVVVGLAASRVPPARRAGVLFWGTAGAVGIRILLAVLASQLLNIVGLTLAGGILLLWVSWKIARELKPRSEIEPNSVAGTTAQPMNFRNAITQIVIADVSMSLDNVLAVAGVAKGSPVVLILGLGLSILLMAVAAAFIARLLARRPWIAWLGLAMIVYVACEMIWRGAFELAERG